MFRELAGALALAAGLALTPALAHAQACCAGAGAVTPARLSLHEDALVGVTMRAVGAVGSYGIDGAFHPQAPGSSEVDLEEDLFAAFRVTSRGQVALLVPVAETHRTATGTSEWGGGIGDVNLGARYDFTLAGRSRVIPGVALLAGLTLPTGRAVETSTQPLATDATGTGAFQGNAGLALEQTWGPWLVNVSGLVAQRAPRSARGVNETLGTQLTAFVAAAYSFSNEVAVGASAAYTAEGDATINGATDPNSHRRVLSLSALGVVPLSDTVRVQGTLVLTPPLSQLGENQPATLGGTLSLLLGFT